MSANPSLRELQVRMKNAMLSKNADLSFLKPDRFFVYQEGYPIRLIESLRETYEATQNLLGHASFYDVALAFVRQTYSTTYNINNYHPLFTEKLKESVHMRMYPFIEDLGKYDWAFTQTFHARLEAPLARESFEGLQPQDWENLKFSFQPNIALLSSVWPIDHVWDSCIENHLEHVQNVEVKQTQFMLFRRGDDVYRKMLDNSEFTALTWLSSGKTLGETCAFLADHFEEVPISQWMQTWMENEWLI